MYKNAQTVGAILLLAIAAIIGLTLFLGATQQTDVSLNQRTKINYTITAPTAGSSIDLIGQELLSTPDVRNNTDATTSTNYTIAEGLSAIDGLKRIRFTTVDGDIAGVKLNISYTYGGEGYIEDSGSRTIYGIVILLSALAIATVMLVPTLRNGVVDLIGR